MLFIFIKFFFASNGGQALNAETKFGLCYALDLSISVSVDAFWLSCKQKRRKKGRALKAIKLANVSSKSCCWNHCLPKSFIPLIIRANNKEEWLWKKVYAPAQRLVMCPSHVWEQGQEQAKETTCNLLIWTWAAGQAPVGQRDGFGSSIGLVACIAAAVDFMQVYWNIIR